MVEAPASASEDEDVVLETTALLKVAGDVVENGDFVLSPTESLGGSDNTVLLFGSQLAGLGSASADVSKDDGLNIVGDGRFSVIVFGKEFCECRYSFQICNLN